MRSINLLRKKGDKVVGVDVYLYNQLGIVGECGHCGSGGVA